MVQSVRRLFQRKGWYINIVNIAVSVADSG
jgi:hypothetical protein